MGMLNFVACYLCPVNIKMQDIYISVEFKNKQNIVVGNQLHICYSVCIPFGSCHLYWTFLLAVLEFI